MRVPSSFRKPGGIRIALSFLVISALLATASFTSRSDLTVRAQQDAPQTTQTVFSNPAAIVCPDRVSNTAGTNPGVPPLYPSPIVVSGLTGTVSKVTVTFGITTTFPDDLDVLLVGPTGARSLVMSDAGGSGDHVNVSFTWDQTAAALMPDQPTTPIPSGTFRPSNYLGFATPEPGGVDNFPAPGPGLLSYTADFTVFNGTAPNGTWSLYVVDDQVVDFNSLPGGWSIDITTGGCTSGAQAKRPLDFNGDGRTDIQTVRNTGGGAGGQVTWFTHINGGADLPAQPWGISTDFFVPADYDGDGKADFAVWRAAAPTQSYFHILQSLTNTVRSVEFGQSGDDPTVIGDYDGDGKIDPAVYRSGAAPGAHSFWYYHSSVTGLQTFGAEWGQNGDFPAPGDFDGDGKYDFVVQRNNGGGQAAFHSKFSGGGTSGVVFGTPTDIIVPGYYDADCKQDIAVRRGSGGAILWFILNSTDGSTSFYSFGISASDFAVQGDYDGDGRVEPAVWRPNADPTQNFFYWLRSIDGVLGSQEWGQNGDYPPANFNNH